MSSFTSSLLVRKHSHRSMGFTLIEMMFVILIIAVLSVLAIPSMQEYMTNARRAEAKTIVLRGALWMERNQSGSYSYATDSSGAALTSGSLNSVGLGRSPENGNTVYYKIVLNTPVNPASFEIYAYPTNGQDVRDATCGTLVVNHLGQRGISIGGAAPVYNSNVSKDCWAR